VGERHPGAGELGGDAERLQPEPGPDYAGMGPGEDMSGQAGAPKVCIYPGCDRPAVPPHPLGGPQPSFCDLEEHNALSAHLERRRLEREQQQTHHEEEV
jgi:hypothetical protein